MLAIDAVMWMYGFTKKEAEIYISGYRTNSAVLGAIIETYLKHTDAAFYED